MARSSVSRPTRLALNDRLITPDTTFFDYGCGRGGDIRRLKAEGIAADGWDPNFRPRTKPMQSDVVNLGYVVNVIEDPSERVHTLKAAWDLAAGVLVVAGRLKSEQDPLRLTPFADGWLTGRNTFQKFYEQVELRHWIDTSLGVESVAAGPGVFYVFRDETLKQSFLASRARRRRVAVPRRRISDELFEQHRELLEPLMEFVAARGRLPRGTEIPASAEIQDALGSIKKAFRVVLWATDEGEWAEVTRRRSEDLLIYLGLTHFEGRPRFSQLPTDVQFDVKAFFGTYKRACEEADKLLYSAGDFEKVNEACRRSLIGKETPSALYVHVSALPDLPPILRVYEGCASTFIGSIEDANIVKLSREEPRVSYLTYPDFDRDPHPALASSVVVPLQTFWVKYRDYTQSKNPPILHRKEEFVASDYPGRKKFARLTRQEERAGLLGTNTAIGTREQWTAVLMEHRFKTRGHRLITDR